MKKIFYLKNNDSKRQSYSYYMQRVGETYEGFFISIYKVFNASYIPNEKNKSLDSIFETFQNKNKENECTFLISLN